MTSSYAPTQTIYIRGDAKTTDIDAKPGQNLLRNSGESFGLLAQRIAGFCLAHCGQSRTIEGNTVAGRVDKNPTGRLTPDNSIGLVRPATT